MSKTSPKIEAKVAEKLRDKPKGTVLFVDDFLVLSARQLIMHNFRQLGMHRKRQIRISALTVQTGMIWPKLN